MSERSINLLLGDIEEAIARIQRYTTDYSLEQFLHDEKCSDAVVRNLEIIGEAANRLPLDFKQKHTEIEWQKIVGLRNRIVHAYFGIDLLIVWQILEKELGNLITVIDKIHPENS
jgi:uncharacterized protein with HEPN domain